VTETKAARSIAKHATAAANLPRDIIRRPQNREFGQ